MRIRVLTRFIAHGRTFEVDDVVAVEDAHGADYCAHGWAEDVAGVVQTGGGDGAEVVLQPAAIEQKVS